MPIELITVPLMILVPVLFQVYLSSEARERAAEHPGSLLSKIFSKLDRLFLNHEKNNNVIEASVEFSSIKKNMFEHSTNRLLAPSFEPLTEGEKIEYRHFDITLDFFKSGSAKKNAKTLLMGAILAFLMVPTAILILITIELPNESLLKWASPVWLIIAAVYFMFSITKEGTILSTLFRLLTTHTTKIYITGERLAIWQPSWVPVGFQTWLDNEPQFELCLESKVIEFTLLETVDSEIKSTTIIAYPKWFTPFMCNEEQLKQVAANLNKIVAQMEASKTKIERI